MTQHNLSAHVVRTIRERKLIKHGDTVIVALSGGADSCALLDLLATLPGFALRLIAAHLNHCLRGSESDADEAFCRSLADHYDIPFESRRTDVAANAAESRLSLEDAGRQARIAFYDECIEKWSANALALGHHRDDQAETFLIRLLRGSGAAGLSAMSFSSRNDYIRPLLDISRLEIEAYLIERKLAWREDASNCDTSFLRNRIRHELLPQLEQYNPAIKQRLAATTGILAEDNHLLESLAQQQFDTLVHRKSESIVFDVAALRKIHPALLKRVIRIAISKICGNLHNLSSGHITDIVSLLPDGPPSRSINLPGYLVARRNYGKIELEKKLPLDEIPPHVLINGPGNYPLWDGMSLEVSFSPCPDRLMETHTDTAYFDLDKAPFPWHVRTFCPGDRMIPLGMAGSKKVKEIFINEKVSRVRRSRIPLVFGNGLLTWICGLRFSATASISEDSSHIVKAVLRNPIQSI